MKNFNEWLSFKSNSYQENENPESASAFDIEGISSPTSMPSIVKNAASQYEKRVHGKFKNRQQRLAGLVAALGTIYDFTKLSNLSMMRNELRTILTHIEKNDNFEDLNTSEENSSETEPPMLSRSNVTARTSKPSLVDMPRMGED
jgi:hypothetical protein